MTSTVVMRYKHTHTHTAGQIVDSSKDAFLFI